MEIEQALLTVGVRPHVKGFACLRDAIELMMETPAIIERITKGLYPAVAEKQNSTAMKVERAMRHAIDAMVKLERLNDLMGVRMYENCKKPSNGEFIAVMAKTLQHMANQDKTTAYAHMITLDGKSISSCQGGNP